MVKYVCEICAKASTQKGHHESHLKSRDHRKECEIFKLNMVAKDLGEIIEEYPQFKSGGDELNEEDFLISGETEQDNIDAVKNAEKNLKYDIVKKIIKMKATVKSGENTGDEPTNGPTNGPTIDIQNTISNKDALRDKIHEIHNFLRNNGAGYGMNALKVFNIIYGLKKITDGNLREKTGLSDKCDFSYLLTLANTGQDEQLGSLIIDDILDELNGNKELREFLFYEIPRNMKPNVFSHLVKEINKITDVEKSCNVQLSGKIYEYFIGRDQTAISELGAYFTDRHIVNYIYDMLQIQPNEDGTIPDMIDMFGGSGGFTTGYVNYMNDNYDIDWKTEINKVHHYDANEDVIKSAALELFCLTGEFPNMENLKYKNSFTDEFGDKKYRLIITNPPYGGDKSKKTDAQVKRDKLKSYIKTEIKDLGKDKETHKDIILRRKKQLKNIENEEKFENKEKKKQKVTIENSSQRVRDFASSNDLKGNDKESVSLIQLMDMSAPGGIVVGVLKEGVFFNRSYKLHRKHLIENFNVKKVVSIPSDQFENTSTKTSILYFENTEEKTSSVKFSELSVENYTEDKFEEINGDLVLTENEGDIKCVNEKFASVATKDTILKTKDISLNGKEYNKIDIVPGDGYELVRLGDICNLTGRGHYTSIGKKEGKYRFYNSSQNSKLYVDFCDIEELSIILGQGGAFNIHIDSNFTPSKHVCVLQLNEKNDNLLKFMYIMIPLIKDKLIVNGSVLGWLNNANIKSLNIPIPKDKQKMVEWSNKLSDPKKWYTERIKVLEKELQERVQYISENEGCEEKTIDELCMLTKGKGVTKKERTGGDYPYYASNGQSNNTFMNEVYKPYEDFILYAEDGTIGAIHHIRKDDKIWVGDHVHVINSRDIPNEYIYNLLKMFDIKNFITGSVIDKLNNTNLKKIKLKIPKNKQLIKDMEPQFQELEHLHVDVENADKKYKDLIEELKNEAIKQ